MFVLFCACILGSEPISVLQQGVVDFVQLNSVCPCV